MMADRVKETFLDISFDWVVPAPLSKKRMRKRNYNQAYLLAWEISKQLGVKIGTEILKKERDTPQQSRLSKYERQKNLKGAFGVKKRSAILGRTILLVDDVTTTGATLEECARTLKAAGAGSIYCVAFALSADKQARNDNGETGCIKKINT
jgi:ComF family protein